MKRTDIVLPVIMVCAGSAWALKITGFEDTKTFVERARDIVIAQCVDVPTENDPAFRENGLTPVEVRVEKVIKGVKKTGTMKIASHYPMEQHKRYLLTCLGGSANGTDFLAVPELSVVRLPDRLDHRLLDHKTPEQQVTLLFEESLREIDLRLKQLEEEKRLLERAVGSAASSRPPSSLAEKVAQADAIVVGKVAEIEAKRYVVTLLEKGSDGKQASMTTYYDLAVLHPENVFKTDTESIVNKADKSNPVDWMHMAFQTPGQGSKFLDLSFPEPRKGDRYIWFLQRDLCITGHYFVKHAETPTDTTLQEIKQLVGDGGVQIRQPTAAALVAQSEYERGKADALADLNAGCPRYFHIGLPLSADSKLPEILNDEYGVKLVGLGCGPVPPVGEHARGYNEVVLNEMNRCFEKDIIEAAWQKDIEQREKGARESTNKAVRR